ncbi:uncharacterized protein LOC133825170 [Humulus lupulus]|uniref:uncharacterized protein LOC133825170 n=1 Tax=Humulus lupulus TaxID=3486 RepID=UPI002B4007BB|nr:uncharacterized protein LOC133825170 [Humulus lupulus]
MAQQRTLKELAAPDLDQLPLCIQYPPLDVNFELKLGLIHLLPSFRGLPGEDPNKHLKGFHIDAAKESLYYLPPGTVETWNGMKTMFLEQYFPAFKVGSIRKEICRLQSLDKSMIDAASGGALVDKTPGVARSLISNMAANSQQFGIRQDPTPLPKSANEVSTSNANQLGQQLSQLTAVVQQLALGEQVRPCGICQVVGVATDTFPTFFEGETEGVNAVGNFPGQLRQMYYEPFSQTYNLGWRGHPNLHYGNQQQVAPQFTPARPPGFTFQQWSQQNFVPRPLKAPQAAPPPSVKPSTEDLINAIATNMLQLEAHLSNKLPSQPERNPKENVSVLTLQSGIQYEPPTQPSLLAPVQKKVIDNSIHDEPSMQKKSHKPTIPTYVPRSPFPSRLKKFKKEEANKEFFETFRKVELNIPLLDAIKQVPCYAKFLKELCTNKKKLKGDEKISVEENVSAVLQKKLPPKCKDPGTSTIPCMIGNKRIERCMIDIGASINVMSYSSYASSNLGPLNETGVIVQLADRTNVYPLGVVEDVLVKDDGLVFPADFYILEMGDASIPNLTPVLFGRPL